jgi:thioredoxin-like negative regulator of GroEL
MTQSASYDSKKDLKIEAYKTIASNPDIDNRQRTQYLFNVIEEFEKYSFDSTLFYAEKVLNLAKSINDQRLVNKSNLLLARVLGNAGRSKEAEDILKSIDENDLNDELKIEYYNTARKLFEDLSFYAISESNKKEYEQLYQLYKDSVISMVSAKSAPFSMI